MDWNLKKLVNFFKFGHGVFQKSPKISYGWFLVKINLKFSFWLVRNVVTCGCMT